MRFRILAIALTIFALNYARVNLCAAAAPGKSALTKLRISQSAVNARSAILWIAQGQGIFAKHGVEVETIYLRKQQPADGGIGNWRCADRQQRRRSGARLFPAAMKNRCQSEQPACYDVVARPRSRKPRICAANASASPISAAPRGWPPFRSRTFGFGSEPRPSAHQRHRQSDHSRSSDRSGKH